MNIAEELYKLNRYSLTFDMLKHLKVIDRSKINKEKFWYNDVVRAWCYSCVEGDNSFWFGIYDNQDICDYWITSMDDMMSYNPTTFFNSEECYTEYDILIQKDILLFVNSLLEEGIVECMYNDCVITQDNQDEYYGVEIPYADAFYEEFERKNKLKYETAMKELLKSTNDAINVAIANSTLPIRINIDKINIDNQHTLGYYWEDIQEEYIKLMNKRGWDIEYTEIARIKQITIKPTGWKED